jgi:uncharacterized protein (DUF2141 family)
MDKSRLYRSDSPQPSSAGKPLQTDTIETIQQAGERISTRDDHNLAASLGDWGAMGAQHSHAMPLRHGASAREFSAAMSRLFLSAAVLATALAAGTAQAALGPDAAACSPGANRPAVLVSVNGFKNRVGKLRIQLYGSNPSEFLERGKKMKRIDLPVTRAGAMNVCVAVPAAGTYAIAVRHDADANGKSNWNDGGGFSNNPKLSLLKLKPSHRATAVRVGPGVKTVPVVLNYRNGLSISPIGR